MADYCNTRFSKFEDVHNRMICLDLIGESLGAEECLVIANNTEQLGYNFTFFTKYKCLDQREVELDDAALDCLYP